MAQLKIKRTTGDTKPSTVDAGELIYAYDTGSSGGTYSRRLFIGDPTSNTNSPKIIGGEYFTEMLDHTKGTLTASSALIVDANSKIDVLNVDNLTLNGNAITSTDTNGNITITPNGTGDIVLDGQNWPQADGGADTFLKTNGSGQLSWAAVPSGSFTISDNQSPANTDTFTTGETLTFTGSTDITTTVSDNNITIAYSGNAPAIIDNAGTPAFATGITKAEVLSILNVEDGADVTDTANVTAAGALMDSEVDADIKTLSLPANTTISTFGASLVDDADAGAARTTLGVDAAGTDNSTDVTLATVANNYLSLSGQEITAGTVPISLGGTGATTAPAARTALGVDAAGTDNSTNVTLVTTTADYLSIAGQAITLGLIDLANDVTGSLPNGNLANSSITIGNNTIALGGTDTDITGLTSLVVDNVSVDGNTVTTSTGGLTLDSAGGTVTVSDNLTVSGDLTVNGTTTTISTTNTVVQDSLIELGNGTTGTPANDAGLVIERGDSDNAFFGWDESADKFIVGTGTFTGASTGDLTITTGTLVANVEGDVTGDLTGNADTATTAGALSSAVTVSLTGDVTGSATFTSAGDTASISTTIAANSVALGTDTTGNYVGSITGGTGIVSTGATTGEGIAHSLSVSLNEFTDTAIAVGSDSIAFIDATDNGSKKESIVDFIAAIAGTNISAASGVLSVATATTSTLGIASFGGTNADSSAQFTVTAGDVAINIIDGGTYP
jgi:hypothetical protein